jgi:hypothetical protein
MRPFWNRVLEPISNAFPEAIGRLSPPLRKGYWNSRDLEFRAFRFRSKTYPLRDTLQSIRTKLGRRIFVGLYFEIYPLVIDIHIYHSRVYISSIFVNEKVLT